MPPRQTTPDLLSRLSHSTIDVLLIGTPSTFAPHERFSAETAKPTTVDARNILYTTPETYLYGDQDHEPTHAIFLLAPHMTSRGVRTAALDLNLLYYVKNSHCLSFDPIQALIDVMNRAKPKILGISAMTPNLPIAKTICAHLKRTLQYTPIFALGGVATSDLADCLDSEFDYVMTGDGEDFFAEACKELMAGRTISQHPKIHTQVSSNRSPLRPTSSRNVYVDYDSVPLEVPLIPRVFLSHGCSARCGFCAPAAINEYKVYVRDAKVVMGEIAHLHERYDFDFFLIGDLTFYIASLPAQNLLKNMARYPLRPWWCQTQARLLSPAAAEQLQSANCKQVAIGFEDLSTAEKEIRFKNRGLEESYHVCRMLRSQGINIQGYWMFGMPSDTFESSIVKINHMLQFARMNMMDAYHISYLVPYPGTPYVQRSKLYQLEIDERPQYAKLLGSQGGYYNALPIHQTANLTKQEIYLLTRLAVHACSNELRCYAPSRVRLGDR